MQKMILWMLAAALATPAWAHDGRRFEVKIVNDQLVAHGYISDGEDDGGGVVRPYFNAIHDHWANNPVADAASADLPGFDVLDDADALIGHDLIWTLTGVRKWNTPATSGPVVLDDLAPGEELFVRFGASTVSATAPGPLTLVNGFTGSNGVDLDLAYDIGVRPAGAIYVLEGTLSTTATGVADSSTVYTILSPDGATPMERLHHPSLYLETQLGVPVPEPAALAPLAGCLALLRRR